VSADRALSARGVRAPARRQVVDQTAAAILLQGWLDGSRGREWRSTRPGARDDGQHQGGDGSVA
jgi:hypothetical protein